jgi:hypothetical protein
VAFTYLDHQKEARATQEIQSLRDNRARLLEARKPFIDKQLALYLETAQTTGKLVSTKPTDGGEWDGQVRRFEQLFWTELSMVEDEGVKGAMQAFGEKLRWVNENKQKVRDVDFEDLKQRSYRLARALRSSIEATWDVDLSRGGQR